MYRSLDVPDLEDVALHSAAPMLVVLPTHDEFLPAHEADIIATALDSGGHAVVKFPGDHQTTILRSRNFVVQPDGNAGRLVSVLSDAELGFLKNVDRMTPQARTQITIDAELLRRRLGITIKTRE